MTAWPDRPSPNFSADEFRCRGDTDYRGHDRCGCGGSLPSWTSQTAKLFELLEVLRRSHGRPIRIVSGYRCLAHPIERKKDRAGAHSTGLAVDLGIVTGGEKAMLLTAAIMWCALHNGGDLGVGIGQRDGVSKFHIDIAPWRDGVVLWTY